MHITSDLVVSFAYTLTDEEGQVIDSSTKEAPLPYLHGRGGLIPGVESALEGKPLAINSISPFHQQKPTASTIRSSTLAYRWTSS